MRREIEDHILCEDEEERIEFDSNLNAPDDYGYGENECDEEEFEKNDQIFNFDLNDVNDTDTYLFKVAASIYGQPDLTIKHATEIMKLLKDISELTRKSCLRKIENCEDLNEAKFLLEHDEILDFDDYLTEYMYTKKLINCDLYREPIRCTVSNEQVEVHPGELKTVRHQFMMMDIEFQIRKFLEIDKVLDCILDYQKKLSELEPGIYANFINGSYWKTIVEKYPEKILIPVFFYNDDFTIDNQIGPHSGSHALSPFYYLFPTLPPHMYSKLEFIFTAQITKAIDMKMFGNDSPLYALVHAFSKLEKNGLILFSGTPAEKKVFIIGSKVLGDNLGLHVSLGQRKSFNIQRPCITCEITLSDLHYTTVENSELIRTVQKYEQHFVDNTYFEFGIEKRCVLNNLPSFHVSMNLITDFMHDVSLGTNKFCMHFAINYFKKNCPNFSLDKLNERIEYFDYGYKERGNKPTPIKKSHLKQDSTLQMNANEFSFFLRYFPLLAYGMIPFEDPVYKFILQSIDMVELMYSSKFTEADIRRLEELISTNRTTFVALNGPNLKPKDHNLLHYGRSIRDNGPCKYFSTIRPEAKHRIIRSYTNNTNNRINISYSVSKKDAFSFASFLLNSPTDVTNKVTDLIVDQKMSLPTDLKNHILSHGMATEQFTTGKNYFYIFFNISNQMFYIY